MLHDFQRELAVLTDVLAVVELLKLIERGIAEGGSGILEQRLDLVVQAQMTAVEAALAIGKGVGAGAHFAQIRIRDPDAGAAKKYGEAEGINNPIIGNKHRNEEGRITSYELLNFVEGTKKVIIRDDICSYGGTFVAAAKELRKRGVEEIILVVTHCENNILKGEVFDYIDRVFTTDSILTVSHPKITIARKFREESKNV